MRMLVLAGFTTCLAQSVQAQTPTEVFAEARAVCRADGGALWGVDLCTPVLLVDPETRTIHADRKGASDALRLDGDLFTGVLPGAVNIANTAMEWDGERWTMLMLPLPRDPVKRRALLVHESWHGVQEALGLPARSPAPAHLDSEDGRVLMRLEWRALAAALDADDDAARRQAVVDALTFRVTRRGIAGEGASDDQALEMNEGLAEYTGLRLSGGDARALAGAALAGAERGTSFVRSFAYASGPAYGLLLDEAAPDWRQGLKGTDDFGRPAGGGAGLAGRGRRLGRGAVRRRCDPQRGSTARGTDAGGRGGMDGEAGGRTTASASIPIDADRL